MENPSRPRLDVCLRVSIESSHSSGRVRAVVTVGDDTSGHALDVVPTGCGPSVHPASSVDLKFALSRRFRAAHGNLVEYPFREYMRAVTGAVLDALAEVNQPRVSHHVQRHVPSVRSR